MAENRVLNFLIWSGRARLDLIIKLTNQFRIFTYAQSTLVLISCVGHSCNLSTKLTKIFNSNSSRHPLKFEIRRVRGNGRNGQSLLISLPKCFGDQLSIAACDLIQFYLASDKRKLVLEKLEVANDVYPLGEGPIGYSI